MSCRLHVAAGSLLAGSRTVHGDDRHYLFRVLRLTVGDAVTLFDGAGNEAEATVDSIAADEAHLTVGVPRQAVVSSGPRVTVLQCLIKGERMEWCVQKLVELGTSAIVPCASARTVVKLSAERRDKRLRRLEAVAQDAARQCRASHVPAIGPICDLEQAIEIGSQADLSLVFWEMAQARSLRDIAVPDSLGSIAILVGPEGGLEADEVERAVESGFEVVGLGPRILRAETASIAAVAALGYAFGDLA